MGHAAMIWGCYDPDPTGERMVAFVGCGGDFALTKLIREV